MVNQQPPYLSSLAMDMYLSDSVSQAFNIYIATTKRHYLTQ